MSLGFTAFFLGVGGLLRSDVHQGPRTLEKRRTPLAIQEMMSPGVRIPKSQVISDGMSFTARFFRGTQVDCWMQPRLYHENDLASSN